MNANTLRRLNWLWKHRHTHDGETTQQQINIIRTIVEEQADDILATGAGAYIHLLSSGQTITSSLSAVSWTGMNGTLGLLNFATPSFPVTEVVVQVPGYYDVGVMVGFESVVSGATATVVRVRDGELTVFPPGGEAGIWTAGYQTKSFSGVAKGIEFFPGDRVKVYVSAGSSVGLAFATLDFELIDRFAGHSATSDPWELVFSVDNWGVTWDGSNWWTTLGNVDNVNPALFERAANGTIINSYDGYDDAAGQHGGVNRSRGVVVADGFLWGTGSEEAIHKVDMSTGASVDRFETVTTTPSDARQDLAYNGTNLFLTESINHQRVEEYTLAGAHVQNHAYPTGRNLWGLTWDGSSWWATLSDNSAVIQMDSNFDEVGFVSAPLGENRGCHHRDGFLYVMTSAGLYRRAV